MGRAILANRFVSTGSTDVALLAMTALSGMLVARLLGPEGKGQFVIVILWPGILAALGSLGLREAFVYEQATHPDGGAQLVCQALVMAALQSATLVALGLTLVPWLTRQQVVAVQLASRDYLAFIPANLGTHYMLGLLQGGLRLNLYNAVRLSLNAVYLLALLLLWALNRVTVANVATGLLLATYCTAALATVAAIKSYGVRWRPELGTTRRLLAYGLRNHLGNVSSLMNQRLDQMLLALWLPPVQLGWYAAAVSVSTLVRLPARVFDTIGFAQIACQPRREQRQTTRRYSQLNVSSSVALAGLLMLAVPVALPLLFGDAFRASVLPAEILIVATLIGGLSQTWAGALRGIGRPAVPAKAELLALLVTGAGLLLLLRPFGLFAAAWIAVIAYLVTALYLAQQLGRTLALPALELLRPARAVALSSWLDEKR